MSQTVDTFFPTHSKRLNSVVDLLMHNKRTSGSDEQLVEQEVFVTARPLQYCLALPAIFYLVPFGMKNTFDSAR